MVDVRTLNQIKTWSAEDRLDLIEQIWVSIEDEHFVPELSDEFKAELERRRDAAIAHPERSSSWDEVAARVTS